MTIRVVLGEDNVLVREGVRALLDSFDDVEVVGVAADAPSLLAAAADHVPDVVVTDIKMPPNFRLEGIDCAHAIRERHPDTGVVVLSAHDDEAYAFALLGRGQNGLAYLLKDRIAEGEELVRAIREVHAGGSTVDPTIAARLSGRTDTAAEDREILDMMARGLGYAEMAADLRTTEEAVDRRVTELFRRLSGEESGGGRALDELKRMHAAVVHREHSAQALRSFLPAQVVDRVLGTPEAAIPQEEVEATILFSDIRGFSTLAESLDARQLAEIVTRHFTAMVEVIASCGGTVDKFAGDAVMAVFGAHSRAPDHAVRALRCALAMQARQAELNREGWPHGVGPIGIGIGVNTGTVIAGTVGGGGRLDYTVVGDPVNVAQRLQSEAARGEVLASEATVRSARAAGSANEPVWTEPAGMRQVKGRQEPVEIHRVMGEAAT